MPSVMIWRKNMLTAKYLGYRKCKMLMVIIWDSLMTSAHDFDSWEVTIRFNMMRYSYTNDSAETKSSLVY
jgi:hypothetical protein